MFEWTHRPTERNETRGKIPVQKWYDSIVRTCVSSVDVCVCFYSFWPFVIVFIACVFFISVCARAWAWVWAGIFTFYFISFCFSIYSPHLLSTIKIKYDFFCSVSVFILLHHHFFLSLSLHALCVAKLQDSWILFRCLSTSFSLCVFVCAVLRVSWLVVFLFFRSMRSRHHHIFSASELAVNVKCNVLKSNGFHVWLCVCVHISISFIHTLACAHTHTRARCLSLVLLSL